MRQTTNRRTLLATLGAAAVAAAGGGRAAAGSKASGSTMILVRGVITYAEKGPVPRGILKIRLEEQGVMDKAAARFAEVRVKSDGQREAVPFEMKAPRATVEKAVRAGFTVRLERDDGWLIAINTGTQPYTGGREVSLTINPVMY